MDFGCVAGEMQKSKRKKECLIDYVSMHQIEILLRPYSSSANAVSQTP